MRSVNDHTKNRIIVYIIPHRNCYALKKTQRIPLSKTYLGPFKQKNKIQRSKVMRKKLT